MQPDIQRFAALFQKRPDSAPGAIKPGLSRVRAAYEALGRPGSAVPTVLVAGTNGKGSTAASLWQMLTLAGHRPALFTSPHLVHFAERFTVAAPKAPIDDDRLCQKHEQLKSELGPLYDPLSFFEVTTLLGLCLFAEEEATQLVLEVGLGGRLDATNIVSPEVSVIASIGSDHQAYLGSQLAEIAFEKAGVMRPGKLTVWAGQSGGEASADKKIRELACERGVPLAVLHEDFPLWEVEDNAPPYLVANRSLARRAFEELAGRDSFANVQERWQDRPVAGALRGRFQLVKKGYGERDVLIDVCHNPEGARAFAQAFAKAYPDRCQTVLVTCSSDKDHFGIARELSAAFGRVVFFPSGSERSFRPQRAAELPEKALWAADLGEAARLASEDPLVICGSVLGIGDLAARGVLRLP